MPRRRKTNRAPTKGPSRQAILVLGMHRSGTSALTRVFNLLGADLPKTLMGSGIGNELGHWEPLDLVNLHDEMLTSIGSNWHDWRAIDPGWNESTSAAAFKDRLSAGLKSDYGDSPLFVVKDPRICRFVPVWRDVLDRSGVRPQIVMMLRNPLEVAASLRERDGFLAAKSLLLWLRHVLDAERDTRDMPRALVTYDRLVRDWREVADDIAAKTEIRWPRRSDRAELEIERFLSNKHRHHAVDPAELSTRRAIVDWVDRAHTTLLAMSNGGDDSAHQKRLDGIRREFDKAASAFGLVLADETEQIVTQERERSSAALEEARVKLVRASEDVVRLNAAVADAIAGGQQHERQAAQLMRDLEASRRLLREAQTDVQRLAGELDGAKGEAKQAFAKLEETQGLLQRKEAQIDQSSIELAAARVEVQFVKANFDRATHEMAEQESEAAVLQQALEAANTETASLRQAMDAARAQVESLQGDLAHAREAMDRAAADAQSARHAAREVERLAASLREAGDRRAADGIRIAELTREAKAAEQQAKQARGERDELRRAQQEAQSRRWRTRLARAFSRAGRTRAALRRECDLIRASKLFDALWYLKRYPDVAAAGADPLEHYVRFGSAEGRDPHPLFDGQWYASQADDLAASGLSALGHYVSLGVARGLDPNPLFDTDWYLAQNPEVAAAGVNPLHHFWKEGAARGLDPNPLFDTSWYLERNPDVARAGENALLHYIENGKREGREREPDRKERNARERQHREGLINSCSGALAELSDDGQKPDLGILIEPQPRCDDFTRQQIELVRWSGFFDETYYRATYPEIADSGLEPAEHYLKVGALRGYNPSTEFSTSFYWRKYPDTQAVNPLLHYLEFGKAEGRQPFKVAKLAFSFDPLFDRWIAEVEGPSLTTNSLNVLKSDVKRQARQPKIAVVMPTYNTPQKCLREAIESVLDQAYENWELCIADDCSTASHVKIILEEYQKRDPRIKVVFREENGNISRATNSAFELVTAPWVALLDHDDLLRPHALAEVILEINRSPDAQIIYSDEDKIDENGMRYDAYFKPDFSRELFRSSNYLNHLTVHRTENIHKVGGWRTGFEGSQDYDLNLRIFEFVEEKQIRHIPKILYHWRAIQGSTALRSSEKPKAYLAALRALKEHVERLLLPAEVIPIEEIRYARFRFSVPEPQPLVSLIVPTRDKVELLAACLESILSKTTYKNFEIIVVDNDSQEPGTLEYLSALQRRPSVRVTQYHGAYNYSAIHNRVVPKASGSIIGMVNNDVKVISPDWLTEMVSWAVQADIGCVGAKLYYADDTIQHAGVVIGMGGVAGHAHKHRQRNENGYFGNLKLVQNVSAVTAACMLVRKSIYEEVGGMDEDDLPVAFNDVDFCLKVRRAGYKSVWTPYAELYHYESKSRGYEDTPEKQERAAREVDAIKRRWGEALQSDPYYSKNLTLSDEKVSYSIHVP